MAKHGKSINDWDKDKAVGANKMRTASLLLPTAEASLGMHVCRQNRLFARNPCNRQRNLDRISWLAFGGRYDKGLVRVVGLVWCECPVGSVVVMLVVSSTRDAHVNGGTATNSGSVGYYGNVGARHHR